MRHIGGDLREIDDIDTASGHGELGVTADMESEDDENTRAVQPGELEGFARHPRQPTWVSSPDAGRSWRALRRSMSRREFSSRYPHPFLMVPTAEPKEHISFVTRVVPSDSEADLDPGQLEPEVIPCVKSGANPYEGRIIVGRARNCDVVLRTASVSKVHAEFRVIDAGTAELTDRGSSNGTWVNDEPVDPGRPIRVTSGDRIRFAALELVFLDPPTLYKKLSVIR